MWKGWLNPGSHVWQTSAVPPAGFAFILFAPGHERREVEMTPLQPYCLSDPPAVYGVPAWPSPQSTCWCKRLYLSVIEKGSYFLLTSTMLSYQGSIGWRLYGESILVKRNRRPFMWNAVSHKSQASILENLKSKCSDRIEKWSLCLWRHDTRVIYRAGTNSPADCVSRHPSCETKPTRHEEMVRKPLSEGQTTSSRRLDSTWDSWPM